MLDILIIKELKGILQSPKFAATLAVCTILILLSVFVGIREYRAAVKQYEIARQLTDEQMNEGNSWKRLTNKAIRLPDPMQIFVSGVNYDIGRWSEISKSNNIKLEHSVYSDDPIFALFRYFDFAFVVQFVLSLLAILFTYDAISGEREAGTLRLVFSNPLPKAQYLLGKAIGAIIGLTIPVALPILLSLLVVQISGIPLTFANWLQIWGLMAISLLYFCAFIMIGLLISALTRSSNLSFMSALVVWVMLVLIIPKVGVIVAGQIVPVPSVSEIEGQSGAYAKDQWAKFMDDLMKRQRDNLGKAAGSDSAREGGSHIDLAEMDSIREAVQTNINEYELKLLDDLRHRKAVQERLGLNLARLSPASAYQLAAQSLAGTDIDSKRRYEDAMLVYRNEVSDFIDKQKEEPFAGGIQVTAGSDGVQVKLNQGGNLDLSNLPRFRQPLQNVGAILSGVVIDGGILVLTVLIAFAASFMAFLRYDVR